MTGPVAVVTSTGSLRAYVRALLRGVGMPEPSAEVTARAIVLAEAWGEGGHGLLRLPYYLARLAAGGYRPDAELRTANDTGPLLALDGEGGLGHPQLWRAAELAAERARAYGISAVSVANSGHCGALGIYVLPLVRAGLAALVLSNGPAVMPPFGGSKPVLSTSPMAFGLPTDGRPAIVDLATSAVARGAIAKRAAAGLPLPEGWAYDSEGVPTLDAGVALHGMLAPLGGAKGYALAFAVEALTGAMVGPALATEVADPFAAEAAGRAQRIAHLVVGFDPEALAPDGKSRERLARLAYSVVDAGGRMPGSGRADPAEIPDETPLEVGRDLAAQLDEWAARLGTGSLDSTPPELLESTPPELTT